MFTLELKKVWKVLFFFFIILGCLVTGFLVGAFLWFLDVSAPVFHNCEEVSNIKVFEDDTALTNSKHKLNVKNIRVEIPKGSTTTLISTILYENGLIRSKLYFKILAKLFGVEKKLNSGIFYFSKFYSPEEILLELVKGDVKQIKVTIPEGVTNKEIAEILEKCKVINSSAEFLTIVNNKKLINSIFKDWNLNIENGEGLLFPETYYFSQNTTAEEVARTMLELTYYNFKKLSENQNLVLDPYQTCIIASIVECEAKKDHERPIVASVFYNRLRKNMKLESCATIQYILFNTQYSRKSQLTYDDLKLISPYNTYQNYGLPPTPISNFGKKSLLAAIQPAQTDYLYFVSDGEGGHKFSVSLKEHEANKLIYKKLSKNKNH